MYICPAGRRKFDMQVDGTGNLGIFLFDRRGGHDSRRMIDGHTQFVANAVRMPGMPGHTYVIRNADSGDFGTKQTTCTMIIIDKPLGLRRPVKDPYQGQSRAVMRPPHCMHSARKEILACESRPYWKRRVLSGYRTLVRSPVSHAQTTSNSPRYTIQDNMHGTCRYWGAPRS
jgi:hypothetical protein